MSVESKKCGGRTSPTLTQICLDMKAMPGNIAVLPENKDNYASIKDGLRPVRKSNKTRINPASHRKTRINSVSKQVLIVKQGPDVPPPYDMTTDCIVPNHFLPPAKICADDDDQDISSDAFEEQHANSKSCALCNRGLETRMMQGSLTRYDPTAGFNPFELYYEQLPRDKPPDILEEPTLTVRRGPGRPPFKGRKKGTVVNGFSVISSNPNLPLDMILFGTSHKRDIDELFEATGHTWCHTCCALWSEYVEQDEKTVKNVAQAVFHAMTQKCEHCNNYGASVSCNDKNCTKKFHYTCASSAGCFQEVKSKTVLCTEHIHQAEELVGDDAKCAVCDEVGDLTKQLFCCNCWRHFHGKCLQPEVDGLPCTRMAWHCPACKICSDCGSSVDDNKMLVCDICDKGYHFYCLKPPVVSAPKDGWKCENCRRCKDCGSNTPGSGATSRWHFNYTVCDSCYQQRNKGLSCPQCGRAYRHFSDIPMVQCKKCEKSVHKECDETFADMVPYMCTNCRPTLNNVEENPVVLTSHNQLPGSEDMLSSISDPSLSLDMNININMDCSELDDSYDLGEKLPFDEEMEVELKYDEFSSTSQFSNSLQAPTPNIAKKANVGTGKQTGKRKLARRPRGTGSTSRRRGKTGKPGSKLKNKTVPTHSVQDKENQPDGANSHEDPSKHGLVEGLKSSLVLFSTDDRRMKTQDMCRCCGSFGQGVEGHLIPCSQCGQCYHPYCVNVKINKVIITKGWRCLDCTFCEGCGKGSDEARLLLCDNCDISYHTYCLDPPLDHVPHGGWKCKWCVVCTLCARTTPGKSCKWMSNYTLCGPCSSLTTCPICKTLYKIDDLMIQCVECERWLHAYCDQFTKEVDVERAADAGYKCYYCRPKSQSFFACITSTSSATTTSRWGQSTVNTLASMSSYAFGTFGPSSPMATSVQHYHPGSGRKPLHPVQRYGSKGTVETSLASRIALGNTGENCSPAAIFLTESGRKHIDETKRHNNKVIKKRQRPRNRVRKSDQCAGNNTVRNVERSLAQAVRGITSETNPGGENNAWPSRHQLQAKKAVTKKREIPKDSGVIVKDNQMRNLQENFFGRSLLMSTTSNVAESIPYPQPSPGTIVTDNVTETVSEPIDSRWSTPPAPAQTVQAAVHPPVTCAPPMSVPDPIETLPTAPDLNLPDPDVLVNQLGMLVTAAEGESLRNEQDSSNQGGRLTGGSVSSGSHATEEVHSLNPEQRRQASHELDILVPPSGDLPMVDSKDIEDFFTGIENELNLRQPGLVSDPLLSSVGVHVQSNPVPQRPPPPPYPAVPRGPYLREIHNHAWDTMPVGEPPPYQNAHQDHRVHTNIDMVHTSTNGSRVEPEFEHFDDDLGPRRPRPESPRADSHKQLLKWQEDEKLGAMATISPVLYANLNYPNLREEYPEWVPRYRAMARLWRKLRTEEREPYRHRARDNRVKLKDQIKRGGTSKPGVSSSQITTDPPAPVVNGVPIERQPEHSTNAKSERPISYPGMIAPNPQNNNTQVNMITNTEKPQMMQVVPQPNAQYSFTKHSYPQTEPLMNMSQPIKPAEGTLTSPPGAHIMTNEGSKKDRNLKKNRGDRDKERELKDKKNQIWQEREREWKLLQQQRQQENRKQQLQNQDIYTVRKDVRSKPSKTAEWIKTPPEADNLNQISVQASTHNDSSIQRQLSNYISSTQSGGVEQQMQDASIIAVPHAERIVENSQSSSSFPIETVVATTSMTSVEIQASRWRHDASCPPGNSLPEKSSRTVSTEEQPQNWLSQRDQHHQTQHSMQQQISESQLRHHEVRYELQQPSQHEQSGFNQPTLPPQVPASASNTPISSNNELNKPVSREPSAYQSATQHLAVTRPEMSAVHLTQSEPSEASRDQTPRQKQQEALQKQQQLQHLQKQQQLQQQEVLQREQRKQLVLAQKQQQEFLQMQLNQHRLPPPQSYQPPQPPRQANQFTVNTKEMPEIDTEEEHQERLQYLYRQRQMQKQLQARQYMVQQQTPTPPNMWVNNAQVMPGVPQGIPSDPIQQRLFLEQQRTSQRHDLQLVNMEKSNHPQHISNTFKQPPIPASIVDHTPKFNFHQLAKNGQNDSEFLTSTQASHSQVSISTYSTQAIATSHATTTAIYSDIASAKSEKRKTGRKDRRSSTIDLSTHSGHFGAGFPNPAAETEAQRDVVAVNHSGNIESEMLPVNQETCVTVDEGNARRVETADPSFAPQNDKPREHEDQGNGDEFNGKPLVLPYGTGNPPLPTNPANPQPVLPPPQLSLSPQQQHMLLQAQQQQLLWQQAHSQLQHQYQLLYQQLQQLQIQLQQTQDPALHQRVLQQQQQLRFLQTQILQHWQQGQLVVQQIHLQVFGLNAMYNQMDPTQQKHMQIYQQELVRQQQQWAQQYGGSMGLTDIFGRNPGPTQDIRPQTSEEKPKRNRRSRSKAKNPPKESVPPSNTQSIELSLSDSGPVVQKTQETSTVQATAQITTTVATTVAQNVIESGAILKDEKQDKSELSHGLQNQEEMQQQGLQQHGQERTVEQQEQQQRQQVTHQSEKQQPTQEYHHRVNQLQTQDSQAHHQDPQGHHQDQLLPQQQQSHDVKQQQAQNQSQPNQIQQLIQQQQLHQQQQQRLQQQHQEQTQQPLVIHQQQLSQRQQQFPQHQQQLSQHQQAANLQQHQHQSHQDVYSHNRQQTQQKDQSENIQKLNQQPVADHLQLQLQLQQSSYEPQHGSQPTTPQQQSPFPQQQGNLEQQPYRTHGEISSSFNHSEVTRDHPQAMLERRSTPDGRPKMERKNSAVHDGSCRPVDNHVSRAPPVNDATQHGSLGSSATTSQSRTGITSPNITTVTNDTGDKNQAPKALEKLEMMVADMDVEAKRTEAETARRAEEMQNDDFMSDTLTAMSMSTNDSLQTLSGQKDIAAGTYGVNILPNIHSSSKPEEVKNELAGNNHFVERKVAEETPLKNGPELSSPKAVAASYTFTENAELKDIQDTTKTVAKNDTKDDPRKSLESSNEKEQEKPEIRSKEQDDLIKIKRQFQIEERDRKLSERKRMKSLHSDRKHSKKETTRRSSKSKKARLTDEAIVQSLKELPPLQLCEPEFLMPSLIIQPTLNGLSRGQAVFRGSFGRSFIAGADDHYANKKFPDVKACLGNPPTPPTSLPPSPTFVHNVPTKEQRVYDMLAERTHNSFSNSMFPTPPYGDSGADVKNALSKGKQVDRLHRQRYGMFEDHARTLGENTVPQNETYPAFVIDKGLSVRSKPENALQMDSDVNKIYSDVNVTLTISAISDKTVHETVNAISELINVDTPKTFTVQSPVRIATAVYLDNNERIRNPQFPTGPNIDRVMSTALSNSDVKEDNCGPYCRHCDLVILGIGVVRDTSTDEKKDDSNDSKMLDYKNINVEDRMSDDRDIFCSSACLKQYYSLDTSETCSSKGSSSSVTTPEEELRTKALATSNEFVNENDGKMTVRGDEIAEESSSGSLGKYQQKSQNDEVEEKRRKKSQWRRWKEAPGPTTKPNELSDDEIFQLLVKNGMATESKSSEKDRRSCVLCYQSGDGDTNGRARLLNVDLDAWVHLNCALWSHEVYETQNGALMNVEDGIKRGEKTECVVCHGKGATILCSKVVGTCLVNCSNSYHFQCARDDGCLFFKDKTVLCPKHQSDYLEENTLPSHAVFRKVFVNRQEIEQIAKMLNHNQTSEKPYSFRIGNLILNSIGQLLPHQVQAFHTRDFVYPVGFSTTRIYWSMRVVGRRCRYQCHVKDVNGDPYFVVKVEEEGYEEVSFEARTPRDAWLKILEPVENQRKNTNRVNLFPGYITGEDLFGLSETLIVRIVESMPGVDQMQGYNMRYGRSPIMELPLAINPSGCARSEPHLRTHFKRPARARRSTKNASSATTVVVPAEEFNNSVYSKQFAHSKTQQYRKLKSEWRSNVVLGRSRIQGLGLFANRDLEGNNMVIEYIGSIIRNEVANKRERIYESQNHGVYMFRIDNDSVIDATIAGGPARYINHSCQPNCVAEVVRFEREQKIIIISNRRIEKGEELTYDYKFDFEDDQHKIPCLCGAVNCRKWMN